MTYSRDHTYGLVSLITAEKLVFINNKKMALIDVIIFYDLTQPLSGKSN